MPARHRSSAVPLAWAWAALIVYASLYPFENWRLPLAPWQAFLQQPLTRYATPFDVWANVLGYLPFGALAFAAWVRSGGTAWHGVITAVAAGVALSFAMEALQLLLPARVPSLLDLASNAAGALAGALLGAGVHAAGALGHWQGVRERWFVVRSAGGIVLLLLWPVALLFPAPLPLGLGQVFGELQALLAAGVRGTPLQPWTEEWLVSTPSWVALPRATEAGAVALGLLAPATVAATVTPRGWRRLVLLLGTAFVGGAVTTLSTALNFGPVHAFTWVAPTAVAGFAIGTAGAIGLAGAPPRLAAALGLVACSALVAIVAQAPADPYFAQSLQAWEQGRFIRFHGAAQWVGWLWPYAAIVYLLVRVASRDPG